MRFDLYNTATEEFEQRGVFATRDDKDVWNDDYIAEGSSLRWVDSPANPPADCRCGACEASECVCH